MRPTNAFSQEDVVAYCQELGLELQNQYENIFKPLELRCLEGGHSFSRTFQVLKRPTGGRCPRCANVSTADLQWLHGLATARGGKCLAEEYVPAAQKCGWECKLGHRWEATPNKVQQGRWCPACGGTQRKSISWAQDLAAKLEGRCLSDTYANNSTPLEWECRAGHRWSAVPGSVQQGHWCPVCVGQGPSRGQLEVVDFLAGLGLSDVLVGDREVIHPMELDVYVPEVALGVEYNGLYWHSSWVSGFQRGHHHKKALACHRQGVALLAFFEDEWLQKRPLIEEMLRNRCHRFAGEVLDARDLEVVHMNRNSEFEAFFAANHLDGHAVASEAWGLLHEGKLVMAASVRKNFNKEVEIARLATACGYRVRGGAGRLIARMPRPLVSFSNNRLSSGGVYRTLGFEHLASLGPSYWYTDGKTRVWRFRCKRDNRPEVLAEYPTEVAQALGGVFSEALFGDRRPLYRIEDYGHQKWVLR